ncbi:trypsin-like peptidase domain-containing protein [Rhizobium laguerreae]|uniref:trypsin-like serine protease n=1 Tax=Rhizobium laguerreae TaxID=1076926 RepID=UPI001C91D9B1|nr:trypsin-like serine protease [Rhizobium laguerreae]MBY3474082.1 trypsin-like peptidase domain-containing protein [Rhizobium laguerreae]MBY3521875.1 trypsin-like peptidase domain-containing protein [Rhizobium laguerreae]
MRTLSLCALVLLHMCNPGFAEEPTAGPFHPECEKAFESLVRKIPSLLDSDPTFKLEELVEKNVQDFLEYDSKCLVDIKYAKPLTIDFVKKHLVVLFAVSGDDYSIVCSGFRISQDLIVTAQHCREQFRFNSVAVRLFSLPDNDLRVVGRVYPAALSSRVRDINDFIIYRIENPGDTYIGGSEDLSLTHLSQQAVIVVAASSVSFRHILSSDPHRWREAVRFSRVNGARVFEAIEDGLPNRPEHCLLHGSPTYPGMSGAAVAGIWRDASSPYGARLAIIGIHLRNGRDAGRFEIKNGNCGSDNNYNIGIFLPKTVVEEGSRMEKAQ